MVYQTVGTRRKMKKIIIFFSFAAILSLINGCAGTGGGLGSISKTNQLRPGMTPTQVKVILGDPLQTQFIADRWVWKYSLHEFWKGWIPYYLVFNNDSHKLESWYANESEYMRQQQLWLQAMPPTQRNELNIKVR